MRKAAKSASSTPYAKRKGSMKPNPPQPQSRTAGASRHPAKKPAAKG